MNLDPNQLVLTREKSEEERQLMARVLTKLFEETEHSFNFDAKVMEMRRLRKDKMLSDINKRINSFN